ncbi:hypothetical protein LOAG_04176 [Loa loa]|uniref:Uncharacterized protein n=1 Tax=Loa loa TaxID=7209 RepID=A0A1S0U4E0_LOALO|nr:hypothetical protein LOAG_04176 [Loa loa]EFO24309.1 hypothetical protein LOAG_04176 [Loa loa]
MSGNDGCMIPAYSKQALKQELQNFDVTFGAQISDNHRLPPNIAIQCLIQLCESQQLPTAVCLMELVSRTFIHGRKGERRYLLHNPLPSLPPLSSLTTRHTNERVATEWMTDEGEWAVRLMVGWVVPERQTVLQISNYCPTHSDLCATGVGAQGEENLDILLGESRERKRYVEGDLRCGPLPSSFRCKRLVLSGVDEGGGLLCLPRQCSRCL